MGRWTREWVGVGSNVPQLVVCILSIVGGFVCNLLPLRLTPFTLAKCVPFEAISSSRFFKSTFDEAVFFLYRRKS